MQMNIMKKNQQDRNYKKKIKNYWHLIHKKLIEDKL